MKKKKKVNEKEKKYIYNYNYMNNIIKNKTVDEITKIKRIKNYLEQYPYDYPSYCLLASLLVTIGKNDEAQKIIDMIKANVFNNPKFLNIKDDNYIYELKLKVIHTQLRIYLYRFDYNKAYELLKDNELMLMDAKIKEIGLAYSYCSKIQNNSNFIIDSNFNYKKRQLLNYSEKAFFEHIDKHLMNSLENLDSISKFYDDFDFQKVYNKLKEIIPNNIALHPAFFEDIYYFKYNNCGKLNNKNVNYFTVVAIAGTNNFISMYPTKINDNNLVIDLNYLKENEQSRSRKLSQIEKFNQKYKNML